MVKFLLGPIRPDHLVCPTGASYVSFTEEGSHKAPIVENLHHNVELSATLVWNVCVDTILTPVFLDIKFFEFWMN